MSAIALRTPKAPDDGATLDGVVDTARAIGDRLRASILRLLSQESFAVSELCEILEVGQPALSHHLKILTQAGLVSGRREGNSVFYRRAFVADEPLKRTLLSSLDGTELPAAQCRRMAAVHQRRHEQALKFFASYAGQIANRQQQICEPERYVESVLELLDHHEGPRGSALEIGPGDASLLLGLGRRFDRVTGIDQSPAMLDACRRQLPAGSRVRLREREFNALPRRRRYDAVVAAMVLHHIPSPAGFFDQASAVLKTGGLLVVAELSRHEQSWVAEECGDLWLGFDVQELLDWSAAAGLRPVDAQYLAQKNGFQIQVHGFTPA